MSGMRWLELLAPFRFACAFEVNGLVDKIGEAAAYAFKAAVRRFFIGTGGVRFS